MYPLQSTGDPLGIGTSKYKYVTRREARKDKVLFAKRFLEESREKKPVLSDETSDRVQILFNKIISRFKEEFS